MKEKTFRFHWLDGKVDVASGIDVYHAFMNLGYRRDQFRELNYYVRLKTKA